MFVRIIIDQLYFDIQSMRLPWAERFISIIEENNIKSANVAKKDCINVLFKTQFKGVNINVYGIENR